MKTLVNPYFSKKKKAILLITKYHMFDCFKGKRNTKSSQLVLKEADEAVKDLCGGYFIQNTRFTVGFSE